MPVENLKDVRPPVDLPANHFFLFLILGAIFFVGLFFLLHWLLPKLKSKTQTMIVARPAWEIAQEELTALENENLPARGEIKEYFVRLSGIVRHYLEDRFCVSAPEMTTDEFLLHLKTLPVLSEQQKVSLKEFLTASDLVKFARYGSSISEMTNALSGARRLVEETTPSV
ncbi:MAG: hypothetical protein H6753_06545 [Candidatus Omnitrophica bacterium]|nr:hypothetical protein [Candidatus Omnitrophota bacterium]